MPTCSATGLAPCSVGLLDEVVDQQFETIQALDDAIEGWRTSSSRSPVADGSSFGRSIGVRKDLVRLRRVVLPMREVVNGLLRTARSPTRSWRGGTTTSTTTSCGLRSGPSRCGTW